MSANLHFDCDYREEVRLADGTRATLRLVRPDDKELLVRGLARMSPESRYKRFFAHKDRLSSGELRYLTEVDGVHHFAIGASVTRPDGTVDGVGVARFVELGDHPGTAESAVAVIDEMQGKGLGRALFTRLCAAARERGICWFRVSFLENNDAMRSMVEDLAPDLLFNRGDEFMTVDIPVPALSPSRPAHLPLDGGHGPLYGLFVSIAAGAVLVAHAVERILLQPAPPDALEPGPVTGRTED
jgi:GNAT superfamily N-acetyltransferase